MRSRPIKVLPVSISGAGPMALVEGISTRMSVVGLKRVLVRLPA